MNSPVRTVLPRNYARIAHAYHFLEYAAFGRSLAAARATFLENLGEAKSVGVFGAGDGRCFDSLLPAAGQAKFVSIDADEVMTALARARVAGLGGAERVEFVCADVRTLSWNTPIHDAVVTHFFLDCFSEQELQPLIVAMGHSLKSGGAWLFADFDIPPQPGIARWRAKLWISLLCSFFRWQTGHPLRSLPPMERLLRQNGFTCEAERSRNRGLIRSAVYRRRE